MHAKIRTLSYISIKKRYIFIRNDLIIKDRFKQTKNNKKNLKFLFNIVHGVFSQLH